MKIRHTLLSLLALTSLSLQFPLAALAATDDAAMAGGQAGISYLAAQQNNDGSINGFNGATDWSVIAIAAAGKDNTSFKTSGGASTINFLQNDVPGTSSAATDIERKILAIAAAGQNSQSFGSINYDALMQNYHTGSQIGDPTLLNDDMFGVIAAAAAHDQALTSAANDGLDYFLAHQGADGGFSYTTTSCAWCGSDSNDTAAALMAIRAAEELGLSTPMLATAKAQAIAYLLSTQQSDGGFAYDAVSPSDGSSTAWSLMALNAIGNMTSQISSARDWLLAHQNADGGFSFGAYGVTDSDTYTTAHAVVALFGTTWSLQPTPLKPAQPVVPPATSNSSSGSNSTHTTSASQAEKSTAQTSLSTDTNTTDDATAETPQVLGASDNNEAAAGTTRTPATPTTQVISPTSKQNKKPALFGVALLGLVAVLWYKVQSKRQKAEV